MITLSKNSLSKLRKVHPDLVKVVKRAAEISEMEFTILEGIRTVERQRELVKRGASKTMNSRHLTGHAVDVAPVVNGKVSWDWPLYHKLAKVMKQAAKDVGVTIEWGGDWKSFKDGPHWQLPFKKYPKTKAVSAEVDYSKEYTSETDTQARTKALATAGTGVASGSAIAAEIVPVAVGAVTEQQHELTSGDWIRMGVALVIVIGSLWYAWTKLRSDK